MRFEQKKDAGLFDWMELEEKIAGRETSLKRLGKTINWDALAEVLMARLEYKSGARGGRPAKEPRLMLKLCVLQSLYDLSDEEAEWQATDRMSFRCFLGLSAADTVPDARTLWKFKERLGPEGVQAIFDAFVNQMRAQGLEPRKGKMIDACIVEAPRQRNSAEENAAIKKGERPAGFDENPARGRQKDTDARWTKKRGRSHYGYKNHTKVDVRSKMIEGYTVTPASRHDSQEVEALVKEGDGYVLADAAYCGEPVEALLQERGVESYIHEKGVSGHPLSRAQKSFNRMKSKLRARVEHVYGWMRGRGQRLVRSIGLERARRCIGMCNLVYNMSRWTYLKRRVGC
jgi:transposase, IS5 family